MIIAFVKLFLLIIIMPLLIGYVINCLLEISNGEKKSLCLSWILGNEVSIVSFAITYWLQLERMWIYFFTVLFFLSLLVLVFPVRNYLLKKGPKDVFINKKSFKEKTLIWKEELIKHKYMCISLMVIGICFILSVVAIDHNAYSNNLEGYEYVYRMLINQMDYYEYTEKLINYWNKNMASMQILYWFMQMNQITMLPIVLFSKMVTLFWTLSMTYAVIKRISNYFWNDIKDQELFFFICNLFYVLTIFTKDLKNWQIYIGPWEPEIMLMAIFIPLFFVDGLELLEVKGKNAVLSMGIRFILTGLSMYFCMTKVVMGLWIMLLTIVVIRVGRRVVCFRR